MNDELREDNETRFYTISDFEEAEIGMTYREIKEIVGLPTGFIGSGFVWETYQFSDGSYMKLLFLGEEEILYRMVIVDGVGREFILKQDE